ncbi:30S ribosomal protein S8 [Plasmodium cynomolgi strain B]|uniref:30S ribosomal protein S8 n=1 Tax=Plasmodium cynomolgi (strain B) TaxID=1120755 RepID=K6V6S1_PLACD|nr:30S ribosomal protein S8 [Plasmodium cynomolgi strain B]GAB64807.1 30S ribosomal protein S8 [Plasmodium cynomolgi strain B]
MQRACEMVVSLLRTDAMTQKCPFHVLNVQILELLQKEGLIRGFSIKGTKIDILLKHYKGHKKHSSRFEAKQRYLVNTPRVKISHTF